MKKRISIIIRSLANFLYPETNHEPIKIDLCEYKPMKIAIGRQIDKNNVEEKLLRLKELGRDDRRDAVISWYIEDAKKWIKACIIKTIEESDVIEYSVDLENMTVDGELKIWKR